MSDLAQNNYRSYMKSFAWKQKREEAFRHYGWVCNRCNGTLKLHVHHKSYARLGDEKMSDLEILCEECHQKHHKAEDRILELAAFQTRLIDPYAKDHKDEIINVPTVVISYDENGFFKCQLCDDKAWYDKNECVGGCDCGATYLPTTACGFGEFEVSYPYL